MKHLSLVFLGALLAGALATSCAPKDEDYNSGSSSGGSNGSGGSPASGGSSGSSSGGNVGSGGTASSSGGKVGSGGSSSGGSSSGGSASGGASSGGASASGGSSSGGASSGGASASGGSSSGGASSGGAAGGASAGGRNGMMAGGRTGTASGGQTGVGGSSGGGTATFTQVAQILGTSCGTGTCHSDATHVNLKNDSGLYARLVNASPAGTSTMAGCKSMKLVVPNSPTSSVLSKLVKASVTGCGARMPDNCSTSSANPRACLTTTQTATIDSWISAGAPM